MACGGTENFSSWGKDCRAGNISMKPRAILLFNRGYYN